MHEERKLGSERMQGTSSGIRLQVSARDEARREESIERSSLPKNADLERESHEKAQSDVRDVHAS